MTTRTLKRPNAEWPERFDRFYIVTRRVKDGTKVTMYELNHSRLGGPLDKTVTVWPDVIAMLDMIDDVVSDLRADGWEYELPEKRRRKRT